MVVGHGHDTRDIVLLGTMFFLAEIAHQMGTYDWKINWKNVQIRSKKGRIIDQIGSNWIKFDRIGSH